MKAVILAGGIGSRLRPLTEQLPKPLIPIAGVPCVDYVIESMVGAGFDEIIVTTGYMSDTLIKEIGDGSDYNASIIYSFESTPMGTAGAVKKVSKFLDGTVVVGSGDVLADVDLKALYAYHKEKGAWATMALAKVKDPTEFGIVGLDEDNRIIKFKEKPTKEEVFSNLINAGIYILEPEVLDMIPEGTKFDFSKDVFPKLLEEGRPIYGKEVDGLWMDIGRPGDLLKASLEVVKRSGELNHLHGVEITGQTIIGENTIIEAGVKLIGPVFLGDNVVIGADSVIEKSCIYHDTIVDKQAVVKNSIIMDNTKIGWKSEIDGCVVSWESNIEDDVILTNSILGCETQVKKHSRLANAHVSGTIGK